MALTVVSCPHCGSNSTIVVQARDTTIQCPNDACRRFIRVPGTDSIPNIAPAETLSWGDRVKSLFEAFWQPDRRMLRVNRTNVTVGPNAEIIDIEQRHERLRTIVVVIALSLAMQAVLGHDVYKPVYDRVAAAFGLGGSAAIDQARAAIDPDLGDDVQPPIDLADLDWVPRVESNAHLPSGLEGKDESHTVLIPLAREFRHRFPLRKRQDAERGRTIHEAVCYLRPELWLDVAYFVNDETQAPPMSVFFSFLSVTPQPRYSGYRRLKLLINGIEASFPEVRYEQTTVDNLCVERITVEMGVGAFVSIAQSAESITGKIGPTEFTFLKGHLEALRELASTIPIGKNEHYETVEGIR